PGFSALWGLDERHRRVYCVRTQYTRLGKYGPPAWFPQLAPAAPTSIAARGPIASRRVTNHPAASRPWPRRSRHGIARRVMNRLVARIRVGNLFPVLCVYYSGALCPADTVRPH